VAWRELFLLFFRRVSRDPALYLHGLVFVSPYSITPSWLTISVGYLSPSSNVSGLRVVHQIRLLPFHCSSFTNHDTFKCCKVWAIPNYVVSHRISIFIALKASEVISKGFPIFPPEGRVEQIYLRVQSFCYWQHLTDSQANKTRISRVATTHLSRRVRWHASLARLTQVASKDTVHIVYMPNGLTVNGIL